MTRTPVDVSTCAQELLPRVQQARPLIQCLTNTVTTNFVANTLLALGASPAMADVPGEAGGFAGVASAVLINLGTPCAEQRAAMLEAATAADAAGTPWVLDPVAVGALPVRTMLAAQLLELRPSVIRGNASEIRALAGIGAGGQGVDSIDSADDAHEAALHLAAATGAVVAVSGAIDLITDGTSVVRISNGHPLLTQITGAGCALGAVVAAFTAVDEDRFAAAVAACTAFAVAGEAAAREAQRPGSFAVALLDALSELDAAGVAAAARIS